MFFSNRKTPEEKQWAALRKSEARFLEKQKESNASFINEKLDKVVPEKLQNTLDIAFYKAFQMVFLKGTGMIEKTYQKDKREFTYKMNAYAVELKKSGKTMNAFNKHAQSANLKNLMVSGVEGIGTGLLGIGIPDIPLFAALILKSIYEIALSYGYSYESKEEQVFILKLIYTSLDHGDDLYRGNDTIDRWIEDGLRQTEKEKLLKLTAYRLSEEMLYMKFIQGIPIVGVVGGISDSVYLKRITDYAQLKYKRRFLTDREKKKD